MTTPKDSQDTQEGGAAVAWSGDDPVAYTRALAALEEAEVRVFKIAEHDQFVMVPQISGPGYRILIAQSDLSRAEKAIHEALGATQQE